MSDLGACRVLMAADDMRDDVVGFHAQQAVEKALKVSLVLADVDFPRSHDLRELVDIATDNDIAVPRRRGDRDSLQTMRPRLRVCCALLMESAGRKARRRAVRAIGLRDE